MDHAAVEVRVSTGCRPWSGPSSKAARCSGGIIGSSAPRQSSTRPLDASEIVQAPDRPQAGVEADHRGDVGVAHCQTPFVAFCDDDSWWDPQAPSIAETVFDRHPTVALLAARTVVWPSQCDDPLTAALADSPLGRDPALPGPSILGFLACSAVVRKDAFEAVGGFKQDIALPRRGAALVLGPVRPRVGPLLLSPIGGVPPAVGDAPGRRCPGRSESAKRGIAAWLRRPARRCVATSAALARAATRDTAHARALGEALRLLPTVLRERRRLPADVEKVSPNWRRSEQSGSSGHLHTHGPAVVS